MHAKVVAALAIVSLSVVGCAGGAGEAVSVGDEQDLTANRSIAAAMEKDVHEHAQNHVVTKMQDAFSALTSNESAQIAVDGAIRSNTPDGAASPFFGNITVNGTKYLWADFDTDEGEGPTAQGVTFVFDALGRRVLFRSWSGAHVFSG